MHAIWCKHANIIKAWSILPPLPFTSSEKGTAKVWKFSRSLISSLVHISSQRHHLWNVSKELVYHCRVQPSLGFSNCSPAKQAIHALLYLAKGCIFLDFFSLNDFTSILYTSRLFTLPLTRWYQPLHGRLDERSNTGSPRSIAQWYETPSSWKSCKYGKPGGAHELSNDSFNFRISTAARHTRAHTYSRSSPVK